MEYENLLIALRSIDAPKSECIVAEILELFRSMAGAGLELINGAVSAHAERLEVLGDQYLETNEDVPAMIHKLYEELDE